MVGAKQANLIDGQGGLPLRHKAVFAGILFAVGLTCYVSFQPSQIWILLLTACIALFASFSSDLRENNSILDKTTSAVLPVMGKDYSQQTNGFCEPGDRINLKIYREKNKISLSYFI